MQRFKNLKSNLEICAGPTFSNYPNQRNKKKIKQGKEINLTTLTKEKKQKLSNEKK